ncbi:hypothetical protein T07_3027 [Trichinella nelsoni]|uniref:Uncharacterized protein n=1 Tax=Trichinella nelsoni TaxID=6336 RepID=A0A0V0SCG3_9BILA|nr:hypothetical protein T07_3027 [Trichinella nelsoni]
MSHVHKLAFIASVGRALLMGKFPIHLGNQKGTSWASIDQKRLELHNKDIHDVIVRAVLEIYAKKYEASLCIQI